MRASKSSPPPSSRRTTTFCLSLAASLALGGCSENETPAAVDPVAVRVVSPEAGPLDVYQEWVSTLDGSVNAKIRAQVTGYLMRRTFTEGDQVQKGQLLYEIDPRPFKATLAEASANLARQRAIEKTARIDIERIRRLLPENAVSVRDRDNAAGREASAAAEVLAASAAVERAQLALDFTQIRAPITGIIGISKAQIGDLVGPGEAMSELTTLSSVDPIRAYVALSEQEYLSLSRDQIAHPEQPLPRVELVLADGSLYEERGTILFADRHVDPMTGSILMAAAFPNPNQLLRPGQFGRVRVLIEHRERALRVPERAVLELQGQHQLALATPDGKAELRTVEVGPKQAGYWVITSGLSPADVVIVEGIQKVRDGTPIQPTPFAREGNAAAPVQTP